MSIASNIHQFSSVLGAKTRLIAVSKTYPPESVMEAYLAGQRAFGENKVQELLPKYEQLPKDIQWHLIGHLQSNKVKYIASFIHLIHSVDSYKLLAEINKEAAKHQRTISVLLQLYIADEDTKFGLSFEEAESILSSEELTNLKYIKIIGFMGMATNTEDQQKIKDEFKSLKKFFDRCKAGFSSHNIQLSEISMGMSSDYKIAQEEGSTMVRIGSSIFGKRH
jgi:hypothetical protein